MNTPSGIARAVGYDSFRTELSGVTSGTEGGGGFVRRAAAGMVRLYQLARTGRPSPCRFLPSCSEYALEAVERHGVVRGGVLALRRIGRCHPWGGQGIDPVPQKGGTR